MPQCLDPKFDVLPAAQKQIWADLSPAPHLNLVLYGGTAIALHLGHRESLDFDFFRSAALDKDSPNTLVVLAETPAGSVKVSFFGGIRFGRVNDPLRTRDGTLLVASLDDLMATKLKTILDRAEAKDYRDIAAMISAGVSLASGLSAFKQMFEGEPAQVLRALGFFDDGDLKALGAADRDVLRRARDRIGVLPELHLRSGLSQPAPPQ
jgi:hypothetical protein